MKNFIALIMIFGLTACSWQSDTQLFNSYQVEDLLRVPPHFPEVNFPEDNQFSTLRWELGKKLFYEKRLSIDGSISCASCHNPRLAFSDSIAFSRGAQDSIGVRNAPSLANVAYHPYFMREGGVPTLEMQVLVPIQEKNEFHHNIVNIADSLKGDSLYQQMSRQAYGRNLDPFVITRAISTFERTFISGNSPYDQYSSKKDSAEFLEIEKKGMELFFSSKTNCADCHSGFNFTDYSFKNNGLDSNYKDLGKMKLTGKEEDRALFKVPSLRNVELTSPYMHDGRFNSLDEVIDHYNRGGVAHPHRSEKIQPLNLKEEERKALIAFLESLTDQDFANDDRWKN